MNDVVKKTCSICIHVPTAMWLISWVENDEPQYKSFESYASAYYWAKTEGFTEILIE